MHPHLFPVESYEGLFKLFHEQLFLIQVFNLDEKDLEVTVHILVVSRV